MGKLGVLFAIGLRNLFARPMNIIIGGIVLVGTMMVVAGGSFVGSIDNAMSRSIRGSVTGDLQLYNAQSKEDVAVFGNNTGGDADLSPMLNFPAVEKAVAGVPNVKAVVPMGIAAALITSGNTVDLTLADLRSVLRVEKEQGHTADLDAQRESMKQHVQQIVKVIRSDRRNVEALVKRTAEDREADKDIDRAGSDDFWKTFEKDPEASLEFLENRVAPQVADADLLPLRYVGTDTDKFQRAFDTMEIVEGTTIPKGHRGFLFNKFTYEETLKLRTARRLDKIKEAIENGTKIAKDEELQRWVKENRNQPREIQLQMDSLKTATAIQRMQADLGSKETDLPKLINAFFDTNDQNFATRYQQFYRDLAPLLQLYRLRVGDTFTIKAFTKSGYAQSVNVKIYGTFRFTGLEKSSLAGAFNVMDLMSFRSLYGYLTADKLKEIDAIRQEAGAKNVDRSKAEDELFGDSASTTPVTTTASGNANSDETLATADVKKLRLESQNETFTQTQLDDGIVLNAAVVLKQSNPRTLAEATRAIEQLNGSQQLGIKVASWRAASGRLGQFVGVIALALVAAVIIIFLVLLTVMFSAVLMATMQRVREFGTVRAIGGQRGFVLAMVLIESLTLGIIFGGLGTLLGIGLVLFMHHVGIPAANQQLYFFFAGPRLRPDIGVASVVLGFFLVTLVTTLSALYPALRATRVSPIRAMQAEE